MKKRDLVARPYDDLYQMMNRFFGLDLTNNMGGFGRGGVNDFKLDVQEQPDSYLVEAELPGVDKSNINIDLSANYLTIEVKQTQNNEQDSHDKSYLYRERRTSSMKRSIYLNNVTREGISAKMDNGILKITVPKAEPGSKQPRIEIE